MAEGLDLTIWSWSRGDLTGNIAKETSTTHLRKPESPNPGQLRIISTPFNLKDRVPYSMLVDYLDFHGVPRAFLLERERGVNHSFGTMPSTRSVGTEVAWLHLICKDVAAGSARHGDRNDHSSKPVKRHGLIKDDSMWLNFSFVLITHPNASTTLLCFSSAWQIEECFDDLLEGSRWQETIGEPYVLFTIIIEAIWTMMDVVAWKLADIFRGVERDTLNSARGIDDVAMNADFASLHNISKHSIYLNEAFEAAQLLVQSMQDQHGSSSQIAGTVSDQASRIRGQFQRQIRLFRATQLRLNSLEKRIGNITSLSFNVVTQQDSRTMKRDSASMNTIAVMTLVFLPSSLIASLFGSAFFNFDVDSDGSNSVSLSSYFWIFWVVSVPCTIIVIGLWLKFNPLKARKQ